MSNPNQNSQRFFRSFLWTLISMVICGIIGTVLLAEVRAGLLISGIVTLSAYFGLAYGLPSMLARGQVPSPDKSTPSAQAKHTKDQDPRVELLVEAHTQLQAIEAAIGRVPLPVGETLTSLTRRGRGVVNAVTAAPDKLNSVVRFFTYYLPATQDLVEDRLALGQHAGTERLKEIDSTLERLNHAFGEFETSLVTPDLEALDLDIELIDKALDADLRDVSGRK